MSYHLQPAGLSLTEQYGITIKNTMIDFQFDGNIMRYTRFVPRFYNLCKSYGFESACIMPSRAFCSDENQGLPIILITKHFGAFPFNHGLVGGIVATDRHGAYAQHGKDLVIIQASHVGYDSETHNFGIYRRLKTAPSTETSSCGKIDTVLKWYHQEYKFAQQNISFTLFDGQKVIIIDNQFLDNNREQGLFLSLENIIDMDKAKQLEPIRILSTSKMFPIHPKFESKLPHSLWKSMEHVPIERHLTSELFFFRHHISTTIEGRDQLERNLDHYMPEIVTTDFPALTAAIANTQIEFDRTYRTIVREPGYHGKNLAFIAGINIDVSPQKGELFPRTKFIPWAAYIQTLDGKQFTLEQKELVEALNAQSTKNPDRIKLSKAIKIMEETPEIKIIVPTKPFN